MLLHEDVESQLARMEKRRQQLLATSPYACRIEKALKDEFPSEDVYLSVDAHSVWASAYNRESWSEANPVIRKLRQDGWEVVRPDGEDALLFSKNTEGFRWDLTYQVREGLQITVALNLRVKSSEEHDGMTCQRVKVGERTVERVENVYEVICPPA